GENGAGRDRAAHPRHPFQRRLDHAVTGGERGGDTVPAVANDEAVTVAREAHRRRLAALLEQLSVSLHRRRVDAATAALTDANLIERNVNRRRTAVLRSHPPSFLFRVRQAGETDWPLVASLGAGSPGVEGSERPTAGDGIASVTLEPVAGLGLRERLEPDELRTPTWTRDRRVQASERLVRRHEDH